MQRNNISLALCFMLICIFTACGNGTANASNNVRVTIEPTINDGVESTVAESKNTEFNKSITEQDSTEAVNKTDEEVTAMIIKIDDTVVDVTWEENDSVEALKELAKDGLRISMSKYGGFEQVGPIGQNIIRNDKQTTTSAGDIVLYSGNQRVVFYGSNSWAYTRLGKLNLSQEELENVLGNGDVTITLGVS